MVGPAGPPGPPGPAASLPEGWLANQQQRIDEMLKGLDGYGSSLDSLQHSFSRLRSESHEGTAIAIALGGMRLPQDKDRAISLRLGHFRSKSAIAAGGAFRLLEEPNVVLDFGISQGLDYSQTGGSAGITWSW